MSGSDHEHVDAQQEIAALQASFEQLAVKDDAGRTLLLNRLETIARAFLQDGAERYIKQARAVNFYPIAFVMGGADYTPKTWAAGKAQVVAILESIKDDIRLRNRVSSVSESAPKPARKARQRNAVFVAHGHDIDMLNDVTSYLGRIGIETVVLSEEPSKGATLIEKFFSHSDVGFAVVLLSGDDVGRDALKGPENDRPRARQNVILELGFFFGRLGRERTAALVASSGGKDVERPSDVDGVVYIPYVKAAADWKQKLVRELRAAGIKVREDRI